ncbi:non-hydrolyzing UDP-N-acetylglucosamine 2-epimerase [candidate division KSB1 bacterium]
MKKILFVIGTRPEAIKLAPLIKELQNDPVNFTVKICITAQHRHLLDEVLNIFRIKQDYDLNIMKTNQSLTYITAKILIEIESILNVEKPDLILVQGDTTTAMTAALAAFYQKIRIGHVEAGLRTENKFSPFPEEINRRITSIVTDLHFAPTKSAKDNLLNEGYDKSSVYVTGNTVIDALLWILKEHKEKPKINFNHGSKILLVTAHRRENFGPGIKNICLALKKIVQSNDDVEIVYPVHLNPNIKNVVYRHLDDIERIHLIEPTDYVTFCHLLRKSYLILSDSGGIQEEAPALGKPVLVLRETTERPEAIDAGNTLLVGTDSDKIYNETQKLLHDEKAYKKMAEKHYLFGDGKSSQKIRNILLEKL